MMKPMCVPVQQLALLVLEDIATKEPDPLEPVLKWAGGKRWLVPRLRELYTPYRDRRLVDLFAGGLAVTLGLEPERALINDINSHLTNLYQRLQAGLVLSADLMVNEATAYNARRDEFNGLIRGQNGESELTSHRAAELFYYLNRVGFNGLCRFNQSGEFNVPFGRHDTIVTKTEFPEYQRVLTAYTITTGDFAAVPLEAEDFIYADPPYDGVFTNYAGNEFTWDDQIRLADVLSRHDGPVVASNAASERVLDLYRAHGFDVTIVEAPRRIAASGDRANALEMLAVKGLSEGVSQ